MITIKMRGLDKLIRQANEWPARVQVAVDQELNQSSLRVEGTAKELAPWDTGDLSKGIFAQKQKHLHYVVKSPMNYSIYQEYGTRFQSGKPFMIPALQQEKSRLFRNISRIVNK